MQDKKYMESIAMGTTKAMVLLVSRKTWSISVAHQSTVPANATIAADDDNKIRIASVKL